MKEKIQKSLQKKILAISITTITVFSVLFGLWINFNSESVVTETRANVEMSFDSMDATGNYKYIYYNSYWNGSDDICKFYDGSKGAVNYDLYCAQRGGSIGSSGAKYKEIIWNEDAGIWISEDAYKKITWIKDNFWEKKSSSEGYSIAEKTQILQKIDSSITEDEVRTVFEDNYKRYKLYQYITWTYVKGREVPTWRLSQGAEKKIYNAIVEMANRNYLNANDYKLKIETQEGHYDGEGTYNYVWPMTITNTSPLDYSLQVKVDGNVIDQNGYEFNNGNLIIKNLDSLNHNFEVYARTHYVKSVGTVWYNSSKQKFIEITKTNDIVLEDSTSTSVETTGNFNLNIRKVDEDGNNVSGATFKVNDIELDNSTNADGIASIESSKVIESQTATYSYTISELSSGGTLSKIKNDVAITLKSGIRKKNDNSYCYVITSATFNENGKDTYVAETESGIQVTLRLENDYSEETGTSTITLVVPNSKKIYDLALTKTMILPVSEMLIFDLDKDGLVNSNDSAFLKGFASVQATPGIDDAERYKGYNDRIEEHNADAYNKYYKYLIDSSKEGNEKYKPIYDEIWDIAEKIRKKELPERRASDLQLAGDQILQFSASVGSGLDIDRINNISDYELKNNQEVTTATYNMNKTTRKIKNNPADPSIITYKITVYNEGDYDSKDIEITDYLPEGLTICNESGNTDLVDGKITCNYGSKSYVWTVDGKKVKTTINDTIEGYTKDYNLKSSSVYVYCKLDGSTPSGTVLYNVAEISNSTPLDFEGNEMIITDRDSHENSIEEDTPSDVVPSYKDRFEDREQNSSSSTINKNTYEYQDDDDFERIVIADSEFDLSLRKSITKRGTDEQHMETVYGNGSSSEGENRLPKLNEISAQYCESTGTGWYIHGKEHVTVSLNDYVEYAIRVYNEGGQDDYAGYASQITDYLPENLEFVAVVNSDGSWIQNATDGKYVTSNNNLGHYEVTYDSNNKKVVIDYKNPIKLNTRNYLKDIALFDDSNMQTYYNIGDKVVSAFTYGYQEVRIICKVSENTPVMKNITNIAEITGEVALDIDDNEVNISDRDSNPQSVVVGTEEGNTNLETYYEARNVDDVHKDYYPGIQDDDDFETIYVNPVFEPAEYKIQARKVDPAGNALTDATFSLKKGLGNDNLFESDGVVNSNGWTSEYTETVSADTIKQKFENGVPEIYSDPYMLTEENAPEGYSKLASAIYIQYKLDITNNLGTISASVNNVAVAVPGGNSVVLNSSNTSGTIEDVPCENGMVADISVSLDENGKISVIVENPKLEEGKYSVQLIKKDPDGNEMAGVQFSASAVINGENVTIATAQNPIVTLETPVNVGEEVTIETNQTGEGKDDVYTLKEEYIGDANNDEYYIGIAENIVINVSKQSLDNGSKVVNSVRDVTLGAISGATLSDDGKTLTFTNGSEVKVAYEDGVITVTVTNPRKEEEGKYRVRLVKKNPNGAVMAGVEFSASAKINGTDVSIATAENPIVTQRRAVYIGEEVTIDTNQTGEGKDDIYTLKEESVGEANSGEYYVGIPGNIVLNVSKKSVDDGSTITNSVDNVTLGAMEGATLSSDGKTLTFTNGAKVTVIYTSTLVTVTVTNPKKEVEGSYKVQLIKKNPDGNVMTGVQFSASAVINGENVTIATAEQPIVTGTTPVDVGEEVTIQTNQTGEGKDDVYTLKEENIGDTNKNTYYIGITGNIVVNVSKQSVDSGNKITNSVSNVTLGEMEGATLSDDGKTLTFTNGSEVKVSYENGIVTIIVTNPKKGNEGSYKVQLIKKDLDGNKIAGVQFSASAVINGENVTIATAEQPIVTGTTPVDVGEEVTIQTNQTGEGKDDVYTLKEENIGDANKNRYYIGIEGNIVINVSKQSVDNESKITNSVSNVTLGEMEGATLSDDGKKLTFINGSEVTVIYENGIITITVTNPYKTGNFKLNIKKTIKGSNPETPLPGAGFKVSIKNGDEALVDGDGNTLDGTHEYFVNNSGELVISGLNIESEGLTYDVVISESTVPAGYIGIGEDITYTAVSTTKNNQLVLDDKESENITNDVQAKVENGEIWVDVQNKPKPVIHKGVRKIRNQDAGYNGDEIQTWVVNSNVPAGIEDYTKYVITDEIDYEKANVADKRIEFIGIDSVEVSLLNDYEGTKVRDLVEGTDYQINFNDETKVLTITFIDVNSEDEGFKGGRNLPEGKIIDVKYKTKFRLDENGLIIGLQQTVRNKAVLTFGVKDTIDTAESETPEVHTGAVGVYKYEDLNKNGRYDEGEPALVGAHFKITRTKEEADKAVNAILNGDSNALSRINFVKVRDDNGNETNNDVELITGTDGKAVYQGLEFGGDAQKAGAQPTSDGKGGFSIYKYNDIWDNISTKYYLVETQAPEGYYLLENAQEFTVSMNSYEEINLDKYYKIANYPKIYDLSLRKFITHVEGENVDKEITDRIPKVTLTEEFKDPMNDEVTTAIYEHTKEPVIVQQGNVVTYTIRIYNEGTEDSYAEIVKDDIPDGVEFVQYKKGDGSINDEYGWKLVDEDDNEVTDVSKAKYIVTNYLSMEKGKTKENGTNSNLIKGFNRRTMSELDYRDVKVQFKVTEPNTSERILVNYAQIAKETDSDGNIVVDRDSTPNEWVEGEDDQDIEKIKLLYFDLALRKWVTKAKVTQDGKETIFETGHKAEDDPEDVVKVDLKKSKLDKVVVKFEYQIRITNEGRIGGWADEITDHIPDGLTFDQADNPTWTQLDDKTIVTDELKSTYLNPGESAEVTVVLRWINSGTNLGLKVNVAEISKDRNEYDVHDVDSTPGNYVWGEDDIDDAPVMLAVKTGNTILAYTMIALVAISIITLGALKIRDGLKN